LPGVAAGCRWGEGGALVLQFFMPCGRFSGISLCPAGNSPVSHDALQASGFVTPLCCKSITFAQTADEMKSALYLYNTLTRKKELFEPLAPPFVGMYVCGPTVYSEAHLGHARPAVTFDVLYRYLMHLGYNVRYVRNITDVGHLENETDDTGEDKISRRARQEHLEPMEIVQKYMNSFHLASVHRTPRNRPHHRTAATGREVNRKRFCL